MIADLEGILALSAIDIELNGLMRKKSELPGAIDNIQARLRNERQAVEIIEKRISDVEAECKKLELDLVEQKDGLKKSDEKVMLIKTNAEYDAVHNEITSRKIKITELEERLLAQMSEKEALAVKKTEAEAKVNNEEAQKLMTELQDLNGKLSGIETEIAECDGRRATATKMVSPRFLTTYDRLKKTKKNGVAVGVVSDANRFCGACGKLLTAQRFIEVKRNNGVVNCEGCGSILIWKKED
ncbi:MAG: hypothetical protein V1913_03290 [Fibrobacterota bacterium]